MCVAKLLPALDVTFQNGDYCYWEGDRVKIPCAGGLKLSGYLYVEGLPPGVRVGLGRNVILPPSGHSGCGTVGHESQVERFARVYRRLPTGKWQGISGLSAELEPYQLAAWIVGAGP